MQRHPKQPCLSLYTLLVFFFASQMCVPDNDAGVCMHAAHRHRSSERIGSLTLRYYAKQTAHNKSHLVFWWHLVRRLIGTYAGRAFFFWRSNWGKSQPWWDDLFDLFLFSRNCVNVCSAMRRGGVQWEGAPQGGQAAQGPGVEWRLGSGRLKEPTMSLYTPQQSARWSVQIINRDL